MPKRLLRGIIDFGSGLSQEAMVANFQRLRASSFELDHQVDEKFNLEWPQPADEKIYRFVIEFFQRELDIPTARVMADFFKRKDDIETLERLKDIKEATPHDGSNYNFVLKELIEEQRRLKLRALFKESMEVVQKGPTIVEGRKKTRGEPGVDAGIQHFIEGADALRLRPTQGRTRGDVRREMDDVRKDYQEAKSGKALNLPPFPGHPKKRNNAQGVIHVREEKRAPTAAQVHA